MTRAIVGASLLAVASYAAFGQSVAPPVPSAAATVSEAPPAFEVASVKPSQTSLLEGKRGDRRGVDHTPGSLTMRSVSMSACLQWAYNVKSFQVTGPGWLESERYDIAAKSAEPAAEAQLRLMLRTLLAERFKLTCHREEKVLPVLALIVGKNGPKFKESESDGESAFQPGKAGKLSGTALRVTMPQLADLLSTPLRLPVLDQTGLAGRYDFSVDVAEYMANEAQIREIKADPSAIIFAVLQEQLGLKLEPKKVPIQMLVIDSAEKVPTEN